jgi:hypothetical protein
VHCCHPLCTVVHHTPSTMSFELIEEVSNMFHGPWQGDTKIVIGVDIGGTQSSVAFAFLSTGLCYDSSSLLGGLSPIHSGGAPIIQRITQWPGQQTPHQHSKIPMLVWYDKNNKVRHDASCWQSLMGALPQGGSVRC